jgi:hypothetical protein
LNILQLNDLDRVKTLTDKIKKYKIKLGLISKEDLQSQKYSMVNTPDSELTPKQLRIKKLQLAQKIASEKRMA